MTTTMLRLLSMLYHLNPRWLYLAITVVLIIPLVVTLPMSTNVSSCGPQGLYDTAGSCPADKVILIDSSWDLGAKPECMSQLECFVNDLCRRKIKFVVFSTSLYAPTFANDVIKPIAQTNGYVYGTDWVNLGFIQPPAGNMGVLIQSFCENIHATRPIDVDGTAVASLPLMQSVRTAKDIHMVMAINYCPWQEWISFGKGQFGLPIAFGCASIMGPYFYVFVDSDQLCGLLAGNRGAYEYESLTGMRGMGSKVMMAFAFGMCFIIAAVLIGNVGFWASMRLRRMP